MKDKDPINVLKSRKYEELKFETSMLVPMKNYKSTYNTTQPFFKPISKIV